MIGTAAPPPEAEVVNDVEEITMAAPALLLL